jgi:exonuclease VII small subunit
MAKEPSYSELKQELDEVLQAFEMSSHDDVNDMLKDYDKAMKLIKELESQLKSAQLSLKKMKSKA